MILRDLVRAMRENDNPRDGLAVNPESLARTAVATYRPCTFNPSSSAIPLLSRPAAASRTILARVTERAGAVRLRDNVVSARLPLIRQGNGIACHTGVILLQTG